MGNPSASEQQLSTARTRPLPSLLLFSVLLSPPKSLSLPMPAISGLPFSSHSAAVVAHR